MFELEWIADFAPLLSDTCTPLGPSITALLDGRHSLGSSVLFAVESERHHATQYTVLASYLKQHVVLASGVPQAQFVTKGHIVYFSFRPLVDADLRWEYHILSHISCLGMIYPCFADLLIASNTVTTITFIES